MAVWMVRRYLKKACITYNVQDIFPYNAMYAGMIKKKSLLFLLLAKIQRYGYKHSDHIITISEDMKKTLVEDGISPDKIHVIYNWSYQDNTYESIDISSVSHLFNKNFFNVVYAGNIGVMQNVDVIIECANLLKNERDIWFYIIGDGIYKEKLLIKAKEYKISNISFEPMQPPALAPAIYRSADLNVIPLARNIYKTALPSKIATCLACQTPIVFAIGKNSLYGRLIQKGTCCQVIEPDDPQMLAQAILTAKNTPKQPETLEFFIAHCSRNKNSLQYAKIICSQAQ